MGQAPGTLSAIFGSATKTKIILHFVKDHEPATRNAVCLSIGNTVGRTYEQMDELKALGILKERSGLFSLDDEFPFHDIIADIATATDGYFDDERIVLERIDELFGNDYYITGYMGATVGITPIDYDVGSIRLALLHPDRRKINYLKALNRASTLKIEGFPIEYMPSDVERITLFDTDVWVASTERSLIDCLLSNECSKYGSYLIFLQYLLETKPDMGFLMDIGREVGASGIILALIGGLNEIRGEEVVKLPADIGKVAVPQIGDKDLTNAINTIMGG